MKLVNKSILLIVFLSILFACFLFLNRENLFKTDEENCISCDSNQLEEDTSSFSNVKNAGQKTYKDYVAFSAVATTFDGSKTEYFNWKPENSCPGIIGCYLSNITAKVTFLNTGDNLVSSKKCDSYIQIADTNQNNCADPSQAIFSRYLACSPALKGGESWTNDACVESIDSNTCELSKSDGFEEKSNCFSLKLFSHNANEGEINFATHITILHYTWKWDADI